MKRKYIQMSMLIQGPTQPGNDINMYLELLKEELETLWAEEGVDTWDAVAEEYFPLRAALITTVQDYLGYGYISCQVCHGHKACVRCMEETMFLQLGKDPGSSKTVYMGHRRWLQKTDPWRKRGDLFDGTNEPRGPPRKKSGEEIDTLLKGWKECPPPGKIRQKPGEKKKKKATATPLIGVWKRRSVFWDLPYWKILDTPHCLDVMHITKNVCESLLGTLLNMPDRTKDGPKARHDLKVLGIREELQIPAAQEGQSEEEADGGQKRKRIKQPDYYCPPSCFTFSPAEVDQFFNCLLGVRVPFGYSGLISRYMDPKKRNFSGMKSHDCHVMMTQILPVAIRGIMDDHVRATLTGLCNFFDVITRKSISVKKLARLQEEIVVILCELEMYFPPAFFDVMVHLLVHIMDDIVSLGPAFLHNMMPFERMNGVIKGYVRNRSHPDGSIVQGWLTEECISFCTNYLDIEDPVGLPQNKHLRRFEGVGHKNGRKELHVHMSGRTSDFDRANLVALQHIDLIDPWLKEHKTMIENSGKPMMTEAEIYREHNSSFARWFKDHIDANPPPMDSDKDKLVLALSHGPAPNLMTYQAYDINGYTFYTEEKDKNSAYQNSGVTMDSWTGDVKTRYYGRIEEIWELSYAGEKVPMFRIRWAKNVTKEDRYFTTMFLPEANKSKSTNATAQNEPWVLAEHVHQCFFITDPSRPSRVIVRRGKRTIVGMDGVANEEDFEGQVGDPMMEESEDEDTTYTTRRSRTTLPSWDLTAARPSSPSPFPIERRRHCRSRAPPPPSISSAAAWKPWTKRPRCTPELPCKEEQGVAAERRGGRHAPATIATVAERRRRALRAGHRRGEEQQGVATIAVENIVSISTLVPEVKAEVAASVQADFNALHAWYEGGKQGPPPKMQVVSFDGSNSMAPPSAGNDNVIMETPPAAGNVAGARDSPSMPGSSPSVTCTPAAACAGPSTLAELNALTALSTPCTFLMRVNGELKDVARGSILRPLDKKWHTRDMEDDVYRVEVDRALPGYEDLFPPNQPHGADDEDPLNLASLKGWVLLWPKTLIRINTYSGSTTSKDKHLAAPQVSVPPRQPAAPVVSAPPQQPAAPVVSAPPQQPAAPVVSAPPQQPAAPEAEEYEREDFQWDIPTSSQVVHEDAPAPKFGCSKKLFDSQETAEEENPEEVAAVAVKKMLSPNTLRATVTAVGDGPVLQPKKRKRANKKDAKDKAAAKDKDKVALLDKLPNNWRPLHHLGEPMLPEHVLNLLTGDMASLHNQVQYLERQLLKSKNPSYPLFVAKVPTGMNFVEKYPADLCFIRFNDIFSIYRMQMLHFSVVRLVALSLSSQIVKEGTPTIAIMDPFYMRESIICNAGDRAIATRQVEDFMLANIKKGAILIPYFPEDMYCTLIVVHPQHSHAVYLDSGRDKKKDYTNIRALLNDALTGFANKAGPLKVERKSRGGLVLTHTTNFPCLRQSKQDNGMDAWYAILQMQEYIKYADDMLLPESLRERFVNMADAPDREIRKNWSRIQQFICTMPTTYVVYKGRVPGVYDDWEDCRRQVHRFSGNSYKGYPTRVEAEGRYARYLAGEMRDMRRNRMKTMAFVMMVIVTMLVMFYVIVV
ncbi:hypothetical protein QYE76_049642 [Lolium multiflorum]|uniref:Uncharacterized protein n=1 Tax=Lolium multiflorum TaxID=4521 RepID=A0AAD8SNE2_LOLMU|nr:hypothetical protein QYE76_049642 [Lolium multiflorum]